MPNIYQILLLPSWPVPGISDTVPRNLPHSSVRPVASDSYFANEETECQGVEVTHPTLLN